MAYKYQDCEFCANHENDPSICDDCEDAEDFEPYDEDAASTFQPVHFRQRMKVAA